MAALIGVEVVDHEEGVGSGVGSSDADVAESAGGVQAEPAGLVGA